MLVSGGSSSGGHSSSVTNMDTGTTIGTFHGTGSTLTAPSPSAASEASAASGTVTTSEAALGTDASAGDTDSSGGLVSVGTSVSEQNDSGWNGESGDLSGNEIEIIGAQTPETAAPAPSPVYRTVASACNIRSYPDYGDNVIGGLGGGETVLFYGEEAGWYKIEYNGIVGYIGPRFLQ